MEDNRSQEKMWKRIGMHKYLAVGLTAFLVLASVVLLGFCLLKINSILRIIKSILSAASPLIYGLVVAYVLRPIYNRLEAWLEKFLIKRLRLKENKADSIAKAVSSIAVVLLLIAAVFAVFALLIPELYNSVIGLTENLPEYIDNAKEWLHGITKKYPDIDETVMSYFDNFTNLTTGFFAEFFPEISSVFEMVTSGLGSMFGFLYNLLIGLVVAIYMLNEKDTLTAQMRKLGAAIVKPSHLGLLKSEVAYADKMFSGFVFARFMDSILLGSVYAILGMLFNIPYVGMISVVVGVTNMIPFFGPYIGAIPCSIILLLVSPIEFVKFIIIDMVIMQLDANLVSPKLIGNSMGLSSFWVLFAILFFGGIWGFFGMLVGVPLFAVAYHLIDSIINRKLARRELPTDTESYIVEPEIKQGNGVIAKTIKKWEAKKNDENTEDNSGDL